jgi:outer membrane protein assembly factor BamD (BamD/ComL family)
MFCGKIQKQAYPVNSEAQHLNGGFFLALQKECSMKRTQSAEELNDSGVAYLAKGDLDKAIADFEETFAFHILIRNYTLTYN